MYLSVQRCFRFGREFIWVSSGQFSAAVGSLIVLRVFTDFLGPAQFGELTLGMTAGTLIGVVAFSGPGLAVMRFFTTAHEAGQVNSFIRASWSVLINRVWIMCGLVGLILGGLWLTGNWIWKWLALAAACQALFTACTTILDGAQNAARQRIVVAWHSGLGQWLRLLIALAFFPIFGKTSTVAMCSYTVTALVVLVSQCFFFASYRRCFITTQLPVTDAYVQEWSNQIAKYAWPAVFFGIFGWMQNSSERWMLQIFTDTKTVGYYAALTQAGYAPMMLASNVVSQLMMPILFNRAGDGSNEARMQQSHHLSLRILLISMLFTFGAVGVASLTHRQLFALLVSPEFRQVSELMPLMVLSGGIFSCGYATSLMLLSGTETRSLLRPKAGSALLGMGFSFFGAMLYGLEGVVWGSILF